MTALKELVRPWFIVFPCRILANGRALHTELESQRNQVDPRLIHLNELAANLQHFKEQAHLPSGV